MERRDFGECGPITHPVPSGIPLSAWRVTEDLRRTMGDARVSDAAQSLYIRRRTRAGAAGHLTNNAALVGITLALTSTDRGRKDAY